MVPTVHKVYCLLLTYGQIHTVPRFHLLSDTSL